MKKKKTRTYYGEPAGRSLCKWLNSHGKLRNSGPTTLRIRYFRPGDKPQPYASASDHGEKRSQTRELYQLVEMATRCDPSNVLVLHADTVFDTLKFSPKVEIEDGRWKIAWVERQRPEEGRAASDFIELAQQGLLSRLRQCAYRGCRKWFFAKFSHSAFHTAKCCNRETREDPVRRQKRRDYENKYYHDWRKKT